MQHSRFLMTALAFEQWLRFAWLDKDSRIKIGQDARQEVASRFPELLPILDSLNGTVVTDGEASRKTILDLAEIKMGRSEMIRVLDDETFKSDVKRFQGWVQDEAENPTCNSTSFSDWLYSFFSASGHDKQ